MADVKDNLPQSDVNKEFYRQNLEGQVCVCSVFGDGALCVCVCTQHTNIHIHTSRGGTQTFSQIEPASVVQCVCEGEGIHTYVLSCMSLQHGVWCIYICTECASGVSV